MPIQMLTIGEAIMLFGLSVIYAYKQFKLKDNHLTQFILSVSFFIYLSLLIFVNVVCLRSRFCT